MTYRLVAPFSIVKGVGPKMAANIVDWREAVGTDKAWLDWDDLLAIPGIGPGRVATIRNFVEDDDPFGVRAVSKVLNRVRYKFADGELGGVPAPTHLSTDLTNPDELVVFLGLFKTVQYKDVVEQRLKYGSYENREEVLAELADPHLLKYAVLTCEDEYEEPVRVRLSRKMYPKYTDLLATAKTNQDVVLVKGYLSDYGGIAIQAQELYLLNPERL